MPSTGAGSGGRLFPHTRSVESEPSVSLHVVWHPATLRHDPGAAHPEVPDRVDAVVRALRSWSHADRLVWHESPPVSRSALLRVHAEAHLVTLAGVAASGGGRLDADTTMSEHSLDAALHAAGAAWLATRLAVEDGAAFAPVRPPGHHATRDAAMGFCLLNNVVVAACGALEDLGLERVLIVDWDVHHGNGTQSLVERDPRIRYVSLHQWPLYPGTGRADERGVGNVFNVPRPPGLPRATYVADLQAAVDRATDGWTPQLVMISAGFDAMVGDPLAGFTLEPDDYRSWVEAWQRLRVPIVSILEGGYLPQRIAAASLAHLGPLAVHA